MVVHCKAKLEMKSPGVWTEDNEWQKYVYATYLDITNDDHSQILYDNDEFKNIRHPYWQYFARF
ncbi:MAG TPA: hypothetical protein PLM75_13120 [bacterium]|nr:hypothetical protein [bacterium]